MVTLLHHPLADDLVDGGLGEGTGDDLASPVTLAVVGDAGAVGPQVAAELADRFAQLADRFAQLAQRARRSAPRWVDTPTGCPAPRLEPVTAKALGAWPTGARYDCDHAAHDLKRT